MRYEADSNEDTLREIIELLSSEETSYRSKYMRHFDRGSSREITA